MALISHQNRSHVKASILFTRAYHLFIQNCKTSLLNIFKFSGRIYIYIYIYIYIPLNKDTDL